FQSHVFKRGYHSCLQHSCLLKVQPVTRINEENMPQGKGWPPGFFEETFGSCKDDLIVIDSEGV
ncbi:MAG: hypothetical protein PUP93_29065, partial [Rhizonema sp. NSF051]|nr:hypothetical protein [Rhizonema sp. NSF051]